MPLNTITLACVFFAGFTAVLVVPGLPDSNLSLLTIVRQGFPAWYLGLVGGAGALTAMVPASILCFPLRHCSRRVSCGRSSLGNDRPRGRDVGAHHGRGARVISLYLAIHSSTAPVSLLMFGYSGIAQFFPGVFLGLYWKRATMAGIFSDMICGVITVAFLILSNLDPFFGWNAVSWASPSISS